MAKVDINPVIRTVVLAAMLVGYSWYAILSSSDTMVSKLLIVFAILSVVLALENGFSHCKAYVKNVGLFLLLYMLLGYLSIFITTEHAKIEYLNEKLPIIVLALLIPVGFANLTTFNETIYKKILTGLLVSMALFILLLNNKILSINGFRFGEHTMHWTGWTQKNYMFWYVLLLFGTVSFYDATNRKDLYPILFLFVLSFFVIYGGYSDSALLSYGFGLLVYFVLSVFNLQKKYLLWFAWAISLYLLLTPLLFSMIDFAPYHYKLVKRNANLNTSVALVKEHWFLGYGYGSTLTIKLKEFVSAADLPTHYKECYPGGHPHNLSFLFWLEFGVLARCF